MSYVVHFDEQLNMRLHSWRCISAINWPIKSSKSNSMIWQIKQLDRLPNQKQINYLASWGLSTANNEMCRPNTRWPWQKQFDVSFNLTILQLLKMRMKNYDITQCWTGFLKQQDNLAFKRIRHAIPFCASSNYPTFRFQSSAIFDASTWDNVSKMTRFSMRKSQRRKKVSFIPISRWNTWATPFVLEAQDSRDNNRNA
jgi:hypothetical protein